MRLSSYFITVALGIAALAPAALSSGCVAGVQVEDGWAYLGQRDVHGHGQEVHEAIAGLRGDGRFSQVRFRIRHAPVALDEIVITFGDGERFSPPTRIEFGPGSETRDIPLPGGARVIRRVDFFMHNIPGDGHAVVELFGR
jgi:hypothetical protein